MASGSLSELHSWNWAVNSYLAKNRSSSKGGRAREGEGSEALGGAAAGAARAVVLCWCSEHRKVAAWGPPPSAAAQLIDIGADRRTEKTNKGWVGVHLHRSQCG